MDKLRKARPTTVKALHDRARDNWRALFAIAETIGDRWPIVARTAATNLSNIQEEENYPTMLLEDIALWFRQHPRARGFKSATIIEWLVTREDRPWAEYSKTEKPITAHAFSKLLKPFGIKSSKVALQAEQTRGYLKIQFDETFARYLSTPKP
jgi:hypothetical protein